MTSPTENASGTQTLYRFADLHQTIRSLPAPVTDTARERVLAAVEVGKKMVAEAKRQQIHVALRTVEAEVESESQKARQAGEETAEVLSELSRLPRGSMIAGVISLSCCVACLAAEYIFNLRVLTWLTGVPPGSPLGVALALAPSVAPLVLDRVIAALFQVEDPWGALRDAVRSRFGVSLQRALTLSFLMVVGVLNLYCLWPLAETRAIATDLMATNADTLAESQRLTMEHALLLVTLCITLNGALFYLYGVHEVRLWARRKRLALRVVRLRFSLDAIQTRQARASASLAECRRQWEQADGLANMVAEEFQAHSLLELRLVEDRPRAAGSHYERVVEILGRKLRDEEMGALRSARVGIA